MVTEAPMSIGELGEHLGTSPRSLRHYEDKGLLSPSRGHNGYRVYDQAAIVRAGNIRDLLAVGLTTEDVRQYLEEGCLDRPLSEGPRCTAELATTQHRLQSLDELIDRLQQVRHRLGNYHRTIENATH